MADEGEKKKEKDASAAFAHLIWFPDAGGYQVPFDKKQTQWVFAAKYLHCYESVCMCVCNHKLPKQHIGCFFPLFFSLYVICDIVHDDKLPQSAQWNVHVGITFTCHPCLYIPAW